MKTNLLFLLFLVLSSFSSGVFVAKSNVLPAMKLFGEGVVYFSKEDFQKAKEKLDESIAIEGNFWSYYIRGASSFSLEQYAEASEDFSKAIKLDPKNSDAYELRAFSRMLTEDYKGGFEDFSKVIELSPSTNKPSAYYGRAACRYALDKNKKSRLASIQDLKIAYNLFESNGNSHGQRISKAFLDKINLT